MASTESLVLDFDILPKNRLPRKIETRIYYVLWTIVQNGMSISLSDFLHQDK